MYTHMAYRMRATQRPIPADLSTDPLVVDAYLTDGKRLCRVLKVNDPLEEYVFVEDCSTLREFTLPLTGMEEWRRVTPLD